MIHSLKAFPKTCVRQAVLALGGGGARGLAHVGAIQAVQEAGVLLERVVGVSIGSLVGALCCTAGSATAIREQTLKYVQSPEFAAKQEALFGANPMPEASPTSGLLAWYDRIRSYLWAQQLISRVFRHRSLLPGHVLAEVIANLVPDMDIAETKIPLSIVAVDLRSGHQVVLERGPLRTAIAASAAIPGIFPPVPWDDMLLCDVGVIDSLPTRLARSYASDWVIGIDVGPSHERAAECDSALHVLLRMDEIAERMVRSQAKRMVDILIRPQVGQFQWFDFSKPEQLIDAGLRAGREALQFCQRCVTEEHQPHNVRLFHHDRMTSESA